MTTRTADAMIELVMRHGAAEIAHDWPGALATMTDDPYYEWYPMGIRVRGATALTLMWHKLLSSHHTAMAGVASQTNREWVFDDHVLATTEWTTVIDGERRSTRNYTVFGVAGDQMSCEITYCDPILERAVNAAFDEEFLATTGVERLTTHHRPLLPATA